MGREVEMIDCIKFLRESNREGGQWQEVIKQRQECRDGFIETHPVSSFSVEFLFFSSYIFHCLFYYFL